jgi:hypothetical protein
MNYDTVRIYFDDGSETVIHVPEDEEISSAIAYMCEQQGYEVTQVTNYTIEK